MKLKKRSLLTVLAVAQLAAAYPASADANAADPTQPSVTQEVYEQNSAATKSLKSGGTDATGAAQETTDTTETEGTQALDEAGTTDTGTTETGTTEVPVEESGEVQNPGTTTEGQDNQNNTPSVTGKELILYFNSTKMVQDGVTYNAPQPMQVKKGVSYVPIRALVDRVGFKVTYDKKTKETIITKGSNELRFKTDSSKYTVNGVTKL